MAIRLLATYEMVDREDKHVGTVRLPVVGFSAPDQEGRERPRVLLLSGDDPYIVDFHPESSVETPYGTLQAFVIDAVSDPIPAEPGWVAEMWVGRIGPEEPRRLGTYPVLAWEPEPQTSWDDYPQGHAVLLVSDRDDEIGSHSGPVSTRDLPGQALYRRHVQVPELVRPGDPKEPRTTSTIQAAAALDQPALAHHPQHPLAIHRPPQLAGDQRGHHPVAVGLVGLSDLDDRRLDLIRGRAAATAS